MLIVDCTDVLSIKHELVVYVSDELEAIPTLKNNQFTLSKLDDDESVDIDTTITVIKKYLDLIGESSNFAVILTHGIIAIKSISGKKIEKEDQPQTEMFSCSHCGFVTQYQVELDIHMRIHYL